MKIEKKQIHDYKRGGPTEVYLDRSVDDALLVFDADNPGDAILVLDDDGVLELLAFWFGFDDKNLVVELVEHIDEAVSILKSSRRRNTSE